MKIVIIDLNLGNLKSIQNIFKKAGKSSIISADKSDIELGDKLVLPGVGAFDSAMNKLQELDLIPLLNQKVIIEKTPILGICLGMQLMCKQSEEGASEGLKWIDGEVVKFKFTDPKYKTPHMGWNYVTPNSSSANPLFEGFDESEKIKFYHVHSFHVKLDNQEDIKAMTHYDYNFCTSFQKGNIFGVQFHPEKSHKYGLKLIQNFIKI
jgi:glutamine amidotransferase